MGQAGIQPVNTLDRDDLAGFDAQCHAVIFPAALLEVKTGQFHLFAIIQPHRLEAVKQALADVEVFRLTVMDVQGFGRQRGQTEMYRGHEYKAVLLRKIALEIVVNDDFLDRTVETIINTARTGVEGTIGDGKIFVLPADHAIQINDGARGPGAV